MANSSKTQNSADDEAATVRAATKADQTRLMGIAKQALTAAQWSSAEYEKLFAADAAMHRTTLVIEQKGKLAGFLVGKAVGEEWEIENIIVAKPVQRAGLGRQLLEAFLMVVHDRGGHMVFLEVRESNLAARALYGKCGFQEAGRRKSYYENPPEDALILRFIFSP